MARLSREFYAQDTLEAARRLGGTPEQTIVFEDAVYASKTAKAEKKTEKKTSAKKGTAGKKKSAE